MSLDININPRPLTKFSGVSDLSFPSEEYPSGLTEDTRVVKILPKGLRTRSAIKGGSVDRGEGKDVTWGSNDTGIMLQNDSFSLRKRGGKNA